MLIEGISQLLLALLPCMAYGLYAKNDPVVQLDASNFEKLVLQSDGVAMVEFYAPWCGHCKALAPQFKKVAENLKGLALVGAVDCDNKSNAGICGKYGVRGFPTLKLFGSDKVKNPYTGELSKEATDYNGPRTAKPIANAVTDLLTDVYITRINKLESLSAFQSKNANIPRVLLFTDKHEPSTLYKALSTQLRAGLAFGGVHESASGVMAKYGVTSVPKLIVEKVDGEVVTYDGELKAVPLKNFLLEFSVAKPTSQEEEKPGAGAGGASERELVSEKDISVGELKELDGREDMALVAFYSDEGEACKQDLADLHKALQDMQNVVEVYRINMSGTAMEEISGFGVDIGNLQSSPCSPQLVLLPFGEEKVDLDDYRLFDGPIDGKSLQRFVTDAMPDFAQPLHPQNFDTFLAKGLQGFNPGNPLPSAPKFILVTNKDETPGVYKALALNFRQHSPAITFGWISSTNPSSKPLLAKLNPPKVPYFVMMIAVPEESATSPQEAGVRFHVQPFHGALKYSTMHMFVDNVAMMLAAQRGVDDDGNDKSVPQITSNEEFEAACVTQGGICIIAPLDPSAPTHDSHLSTLNTCASRRASEPVQFMWVDAKQHRGFVRSLGMLLTSRPSVVAYSPRKHRAAVLSTAFSVDSVHAFVDDVLLGRVRSEVLQVPPSFLVAAGSEEQVDSEEEEEVVVEEEFDLSDIMSEEVESAGVGTKAEKLQQVEEELRRQKEEAAQAAAQKAKKKAKSKKKSKSKKSKDEL